jgi:LacI family transcriptional regulator
MSSKKPRIKDIARMAGVSIGTIDRVIHNRGEVAEKTKLKVQQLLKETNYSPNVVAQALKSKKLFHLVSLLPESSNENSFWQKHSQGLYRVIQELDPFPVRLSQLTFDMQSEADFQEKAARVIDLKPDGVLLAPIFKSESIIFCKTLRHEEIPFVFIDGFIENTGFLAYVGEDIFQSGRVAGQLIDLITPADNDILIVSIARNLRNVHHLDRRADGFMSYFSSNCKNKGKIISLNIPDSVPETIKKAIDKVRRDNKGIGSIFITGSRSHLIAAYLEKNKLSYINLLGYDLLDLNVKYLKSGTTRFLIGQRPDEQIYKAIRKLFEFVSQNKVPEQIEYLPVDIITSENVDFFL